MSEKTKFRLSEIMGIEKYFYQVINQRKLCIKRSIKYVTVFDYIDKIITVLGAWTGGVPIKSFTFRSARFKLFFSFKIGIIKKLLSIT